MYGGGVRYATHCHMNLMGDPDMIHMCRVQQLGKHETTSGHPFFYLLFSSFGWAMWMPQPHCTPELPAGLHHVPLFQDYQTSRQMSYNDSSLPYTSPIDHSNSLLKLIDFSNSSRMLKFPANHSKISATQRHWSLQLPTTWPPQQLLWDCNLHNVLPRYFLDERPTENIAGTHDKCNCLPIFHLFIK